MTSPPQASGRAWRPAFAFTLALGMAVSVVMQYALGALGPHVTADLDITRTQLGLLSTLLFAVAGLSTGLCGPIVAVVGAQRLLLGVFGLASTALVLASVASSFVWLLVASAVAGLALSAADPATNQLVSNLLPRGQQGLVVGVKQAGVQASALAVGVTMPALAATAGWRGALATGLVLAVAGIVLTASVVPRHHERAHHRSPPLPPPLRSTVRYLSMYGFLMATGAAAVGAYLPLFAAERLQFSFTAAGFLTGVVGFSGMIARVLWSRWAEHAGSVPLLLGSLAVAGAMAQALILLAEPLGGQLVWVGALGFGVAALGWNAVGMLVVVREAGVAAAGRASGRVMRALFGGLVVSPLGFGAIVDGTGSYALAWSIVAVLFLLAGLVAARWHVAVRRSRSTTGASD